MPTNTEYWRAAVVVVVTDATDQLMANGKMTQRMFDNERLETFNAQTAGDDASLMRCLKHYCPDDLQAYIYPGPDHRTTMYPDF
jgi:hypothetical protein